MPLILRRSFLGLLAALLLSSAPALAADAISGLYEAAGKGPDGTPYQGVVQIVPYGNAHAILWKLSGGQGYKGLALRKDDVVGAAYGVEKIPGLVIYRINGGKLEGDWVGGGNAAKHELGRETLEGPEGLSGEYKITLGENQDGTTNYDGKVLIKPDGDTYILVWMVPKPAYVGRGVKLGDVLVVGYGMANDPKSVPGVVAYKMEGPDAMSGVWATGGGKKMGSESLKRRPPQ